MRGRASRPSGQHGRAACGGERRARTPCTWAWTRSTPGAERTTSPLETLAEACDVRASARRARVRDDEHRRAARRGSARPGLRRPGVPGRRRRASSCRTSAWPRSSRDAPAGAPAHLHADEHPQPRRHRGGGPLGRRARDARARAVPGEIELSERGGGRSGHGSGGVRPRRAVRVLLGAVLHVLADRRALGQPGHVRPGVPASRTSCTRRGEGALPAPGEHLLSPQRSVLDRPAAGARGARAPRRSSWRAA